MNNEDDINESKANFVSNETLNDLHRKRAMQMVLYLIYVEIVLITGIKLQAFHQRAAFFKVDTTFQNSTFGSPVAPSPVNPLPIGILAFDTETNETTVQQGTNQAAFMFSLTNISKAQVVIEDVRTSCGCTVARTQPLPWTLKPKDSGQISVTMNVLGLVDRNTKTVTVYTDHGAKALEVVATIVPAKEKP